MLKTTLITAATVATLALGAVSANAGTTLSGDELRNAISGKVMAASTMINCQPQKVKEAKAGANSFV